ncbi:MAG: shikimate dehydrogenase [Rhodanobacteraceae bacterium]|nr:MAG: shikimate dehydrogenase [Rhodanobacteraceae bacterium]
MSVPYYSVFGHPIAHSLSPRLHALFATQARIALDYVAIDAAPADFERSLRSFFDAGGRGANVTLPHKAAAFALAEVRSPTARRLGVANVLTRLADGRLEADSNDGAGMLADLTRCGVDAHGQEVLLLGAGGAARAAAFALLDAGVARLTVANRTLERAQALVDALATPVKASALHWNDLDDAPAFDLIINATSAGVQHATLALPVSLANTDTVAYDLSYGAAAKPFVGWAQRTGCKAAFDGLGMLFETAAASFERWHGARPDVEAALQSLLSAGRHPPDAAHRC